MGLRIGMIGVGGLGYLQARTYAELEDVELVAAADVSPDARALFEDEFGGHVYEHYRDLLNEHADEVDAVTVVTPHTLHYEQVMACLERDLHVLVEKPMVTDVGHAVDVVDAAADRDLVVQVGYQRRFHPAFVEIRRVVDDGRVGDLHTANCYLGQGWYEPHSDTWRTDPSLSGGGQLYDSGSHLLDALLWTTATDPASVAASVEYVEPRVDVNSALSLRLSGPERELIASVAITGRGNDITPSEGYVFWGDGGRLSYTDDRIVVAERDAATYRTEIAGDTDFQTLNRRKIRNFVESTEGTAEPAVPGEVGLQVTALTEAAYRADERGERVSVPDLVEAARDKRK